MKVGSILSLGYFGRSISAKIQCSILHCTLHNLSYILCLSLKFALAIQFFLHSAFNFDLCNIPVFAFDIQLFHNQQSSFRIRPSSSVECTFIFSHPSFSLCPLSFRFRHPTLGIVLAIFRIRHSTFGIELLPAGQRPMEIVGSINLAHPRANCGRESVERLPSGVDCGDLLHSRQTRRRQQIEHGRSPGCRCTVFEGGVCCSTDCLL